MRERGYSCPRLLTLDPVKRKANWAVDDDFLPLSRVEGNSPNAPTAFSPKLQSLKKTVCHRTKKSSSAYRYSTFLALIRNFVYFHIEIRITCKTDKNHIIIYRKTKHKTGAFILTPKTSCVGWFYATIFKRNIFSNHDALKTS